MGLIKKESSKSAYPVESSDVTNIRKYSRIKHVLLFWIRLKTYVTVIY